MNGVYRPGDSVLNGWNLTRLIGEGSYGKVFEAVRSEYGIKETAAIKIITIPQNQDEIIDARAEGMNDNTVRKYFESFVGEVVQEVALMSKLKGNDNIVNYEDYEVVEFSDGIGWDIIIRMELLRPLQDVISNLILSKKMIIKLGIDICKALELCQKYNIIHRDIKPENIFLSDNGSFKLGDFGIARTIDKTIGELSKKGTYTYMAPEVYNDESYGASVDLYSLGIVLYRLLNDNRAPFLPPYPTPIIYQDRNNALVKRISGENLPYPVNDNGELAEIVMKACSFDPDKRYQNPTDMRHDLISLLKDTDKTETYDATVGWGRLENATVSIGSRPTTTARNTAVEEKNRKQKNSILFLIFLPIISLLVCAFVYIGRNVISMDSSDNNIDESTAAAEIDTDRPLNSSAENLTEQDRSEINKFLLDLSEIIYLYDFDCNDEFLLKGSLPDRNASAMEQLMYHLMGGYILQDHFDLYPGQKFSETLMSAPGEFNHWSIFGEHRCFDSEKIEWILKNIFHCTDVHIKHIRELSLDKECYYSYHDGKYYMDIGGRGSGFPEISIRKIIPEADGYRVEFDFFDNQGGRDYLDYFKAVLKKENIDGIFYWTVVSIKGVNRSSQIPFSSISQPTATPNTASNTPVPNYYGHQYSFQQQYNIVEDEAPVVVDVQNMTVPFTIKEGASFSITGLISVDNGLLESLFGTVYDELGNQVLLASTSISKPEFQLKNSNIDKELRFGTLPAGSYSYKLAGHIRNTDVTLPVTTYIELVSCQFEIY